MSPEKQRIVNDMNEKPTKPVVGQVFYCRHPYRSGDNILTVTCTKVGREYFHVEGHGLRSRKFCIKGMKDAENSGVSVRLFSSQQEILDVDEHHLLGCELRRFNFHSVSLARLRRIMEIIKEPT